MVRNVYRRIFPKHPLVGGFLTAGCLCVLASAAYALSQGEGMEGSWRLYAAGNGVCTWQRTPDYCHGINSVRTYCNPQSDVHPEFRYTAKYGNACDPYGSAVTPANPNTSRVIHMETVYTQ